MHSQLHEVKSFHLGAVMAQLLSIISSIFLLFLAKTFTVQRATSQPEESAYITPTSTYDEWYQSGMNSYTNGEWDDTIYYFEKALEEFKFHRTWLANCRLKCGNTTRSFTVSNANDPLEEMQYFQGLFTKANCVRRCKSEKLGSRPEVINDDVTDKFLSRMPYSYLQFAYYKSFEYEKAVAAAYTYLQWNPDDDVMQNNLDYYRNLHGITEEHLIDLEENTHHKYFMQGYKAYERGEFASVIENMESALKHYWQADEECRALCEGRYESRESMDLYEALSNHYASVLFCKSQCEEWTSRMNGKVVDNYLSNHYHFLQFAYYKEGKLAEAVNAAASFLLLKPNDPTMTSNMEYYEEEGANKYTIRPSLEAGAYQKRKDLETKLLAFAKMKFWEEEDQEYLEDLFHSNNKPVLYRDDAEPINPDEVLLRGDAFSKHMRQEDVWKSLVEDQDIPPATVEHFPESFFQKPEEIWPEEMGDEDKDMIEMMEYSPEPWIDDGNVEDIELEENEKYFLKPEEMWPEPELNDGEDEEMMGMIKEYSPEPWINKRMEDVGEDGTEETDRTDVIKEDKDLSRDDSKVRPSSTDSDKEVQDLKEDLFDAVKWPKIEETSQLKEEEDGNTNNIKETDINTMETKNITGGASVARKKRRDMLNHEKFIKKEENEELVVKKDENDRLSALESLKRTVREQEFPSGPPRAGPSQHGRRYLERTEEDLDETKYTPSLDGVRLYKNAAMLNGTKRMAAENIATKIDCENLIKLMDIESKMGDGYNGKAYPHTKFESYEGITIMVAVNAARVGRIPLILPATYMHLAEKSRIFMKKYFQIRDELYFSYTHLVCRTAEPDSQSSRQDLSHPIHADNCQLDQHGVCHKTPPSFTWRDWSAVLYLNDDFVGGNFIFAHPNLTVQSELRPKCGRLVGFSAGEENLHGVKGVISGRRCALALWFTEDAHYQEGEFNEAAIAFREIWEEQKARSKTKNREEL